MELYIFNRDLEFQGIFESYSSLRWVRRYNKCGEFELQCALTEKSLNLLQRDTIIYKKGDNEAGYIEYRQLKQDWDGKEILILKGKFLTGYLSRRIIWGTDILNTTAENAMRTLVNKNCIAPIDTSRVIPNFILGALNNFIDEVNYQTSYKNLLDEVEILSNLSNIGYRIKFDTQNRKLIFETYKGRDRSANQSVNSRCIFSKEFDNVLEQEYTDSLNNYRNLCLIGGMGEGAARKLSVVGNSMGLDRYEIFNDQRSLSNTVDNVVMSDLAYSNLLIGKGNEILTNTKEIQTFDSKINLNSNLKYKVDFDLGDIVTVKSKKWDVTIHSRITEIEEVYEQAGMAVNVTFGNNIPTLVDKIKTMAKQNFSSDSGGDGQGIKGATVTTNTTTKTFADTVNLCAIDTNAIEGSLIRAIVDITNTSNDVLQFEMLTNDKRYIGSIAAGKSKSLTIQQQNMQVIVTGTGTIAIEYDTIVN